jgi:hypothetical protein
MENEEVVEESAPTPHRRPRTLAVTALVVVALGVGGFLLTTHRSNSAPDIRGFVAVTDPLGHWTLGAPVCTHNTAAGPVDANGNPLNPGYSGVTNSCGAPTTGGPCETDGGFSDIAIGTPVTVRDERGVIVGTGELGVGETMSTTECRFPFTVTHLPKVNFYSVEVSHRGTTVKARRDARNGTLSFELTLAG